MTSKKVYLSPNYAILTPYDAVMPYDWKGNRGFGVGLAMCHRQKLFIYPTIQGLMNGNGHFTNTPVYDTLYVHVRYSQSWIEKP